MKFSAYDFSIYGGLKGEVINISADTIQDEIDRERYYIIKVRNSGGKLMKDGEELPVIPGMVDRVQSGKFRGSSSILRKEAPAFDWSASAGRRTMSG